MKLILLGPPGAGKGTVAVKLAQDFNLQHISTGEIFRAEMKAGTDLGEKIRETMDAGILVSDDLTIQVVKPYLDGDIILDGYPRTIPQAEDLEKISINGVVYLAVPDENLVGRLSNRQFCGDCGRLYNLISTPPQRPGVCDNDGSSLLQREDDKPEAVERRLKIYHRQTEPLLEFYELRNLLKRVDGSLKPNEVYTAVKDLVKSLQP